MARNFTEKQVLQAIKDSRGLILQVAKLLGCNYRTAKKYVDKWDTTKAALNDEKQGALDVAENRLMAKIDDGDMKAIMFYLNNQGKERGYGLYNMKVEATGPDGGPIEVELTPSEREKRIIALLEKRNAGKADKG